MSYFTKARNADYYNNLLEGSEADFLKLIKKYCLCPPSQISNYRGKDVGDVDVASDNSATPLLQNSKRSTNVRLAKIPKSHKVAYIDLRLEARHAVGGGTRMEGGDHIYFDCDYAQQANYVPVYYLPWDDSGASIRLTIPRMGSNNPDPRVFFTAAINGCSIFFQGTQDNPTVYHCGGSTGYGSDVQKATDFWEEVMTEFLASDQKAGAMGPLGNRNVNKQEYITTPNVKAKQVGPTGIASKELTTNRAKSYQGDLVTKHRAGKLTVRQVSPWACVLGRRNDAGDWTFYLQENATIQYHEVKRELPNLFKPTISPTYSVARPLLVREIFPQGSKHTTVRAGLPSIL